MSLIVHCRHSGRHTTAQSFTRYLRALSYILLGQPYLVANKYIHLPGERCSWVRRSHKITHIRRKVLYEDMNMGLAGWWYDADAPQAPKSGPRLEAKYMVCSVDDVAQSPEEQNRTEQSRTFHAHDAYTNHMHNGTLGRMANVAPHLRHMWW